MGDSSLIQILVPSVLVLVSLVVSYRHLLHIYVRLSS